MSTNSAIEISDVEVDDVFAIKFATIIRQVELVLAQKEPEHRWPKDRVADIGLLMWDLEVLYDKYLTLKYEIETDPSILFFQGYKDCFSWLLCNIASLMDAYLYDYVALRYTKLNEDSPQVKAFTFGMGYLITNIDDPYEELMRDLKSRREDMAQNFLKEVEKLYNQRFESAKSSES